MQRNCQSPTDPFFLFPLEMRRDICETPSNAKPLGSIIGNSLPRASTENALVPPLSLHSVPLDSTPNEEHPPAPQTPTFSLHPHPRHRRSSQSNGASPRNGPHLHSMFSSDNMAAFAKEFRKRLTRQTSAKRLQPTTQHTSTPPEIRARPVAPPRLFYHSQLSSIILLQSALRRWRAQEDTKRFVKNIRGRQQIVEEMVRTERTYYQQLQVLQHNFLDSLQEQSEVDFQKLSSQIQIMCNYSQSLLAKLESQIHSWNAHSQIGRVFLDYAGFLKVYTQYVQTYREIQQAISQARKKSSRFAKRLQEMETKTNSQSINTFLILPVQRLPRYELMLKNLLDKTVRFHPDYSDIQSALQRIIEVTSYVDKSEKEFEDTRRVLRVQSSFTGKFPWMALPHRRYVHDGPVMEPESKKLRHWFLFNDLLVVTKKPSGEQRYHVLDLLYLTNFSLCEIIPSESRGDDESRCLFFKMSTMDIYAFLLASEEEKVEWQTKITALQESLCRSLASIDTEQPLSPLHTESPHMRNSGRKRAKKNKARRTTTALASSPVHDRE